MEQQINKKIDAAFDSIEGMQPAEPKPFLLTRINAAMQQVTTGNTWMQIASFVKRPVVAGVSIACILLLNIYAFNSSGIASSKDMAKSIRASKYDFTTINVSGIYDTEIQEP